MYRYLVVEPPGHKGVIHKNHAKQKLGFSRSLYADIIMPFIIFTDSIDFFSSFDVLCVVLLDVFLFVRWGKCFNVLLFFCGWGWCRFLLFLLKEIGAIKGMKEQCFSLFSRKFLLLLSIYEGRDILKIFHSF